MFLLKGNQRLEAWKATSGIMNGRAPQCYRVRVQPNPERDSLHQSIDFDLNSPIDPTMSYMPLMPFVKNA